ncbi:C2 domain-containing protein, partial [Russula aff. rugulosa BPL654]
ASVLAKPDVSSLPDPFAVIIIDSEQTRTTSVIKKTLNPHWNEHFDVMVKSSSVVMVQIFDQRNFNQRDQGLLGFVEIRVTDYLDLELGGQGMFFGFRIVTALQLLTNESLAEMVQLDLKGTDGNPVVQGKLISHLSTMPTTSATSSRSTDSSSLALTTIPSNGSSRLVNNPSVDNALVDNTSVDNTSVDNTSVDYYSADDHSVDNYSVDNYSINNYSVKQH